MGKIICPVLIVFASFCIFLTVKTSVQNLKNPEDIEEYLNSLENSEDEEESFSEKPLLDLVYEIKQAVFPQERYVFYYAEIKEMENQEGPTLSNYSTTYTYFYSGLEFVKLIDLDGDGQDELIAVAGDSSELRIYDYENGKLNQTLFPDFHVKALGIISEGEKNFLVIEDTENVNYRIYKSENLEEVKMLWCMPQELDELYIFSFSLEDENYEEKYRNYKKTSESLKNTLENLNDILGIKKEKREWAELYLDYFSYLADKEASNVYQYFCRLIYLDEDDIPELFVLNSSAGSAELILISDGNIIRIYFNNYLQYDKKSGILFCSTGGYDFECYFFKNGECEIIDWGHDSYYDNFIIWGKTVNEEDFLSYMEKYLDFENDSIQRYSFGSYERFIRFIRFLDKHNIEYDESKIQAFYFSEEDYIKYIYGDYDYYFENSGFVRLKEFKEVLIKEACPDLDIFPADDSLLSERS